MAGFLLSAVQLFYVVKPAAIISNICCRLDRAGFTDKADDITSISQFDPTQSWRRGYTQQEVAQIFNRDGPYLYTDGCTMVLITYQTRTVRWTPCQCSQAVVRGSCCCCYQKRIELL